MSGQTPDAWIAAARFAEHAAEVSYDGLPHAVVNAVRAFLLDTVGVGIAGAQSQYAQTVRSVLAKEPGSDGRCSLWGGGDEADPRSAAAINAFQAHAQEFDCVHEAAVLHPFTVVTPVLMSQAQVAPMSGRTLIAAAAVGVDVAAGLGVAAKSQIRFFRPATCGLFGATAALAHARGLDADATTHALGYALAFASGAMQAHVEGTPALAVQIANAARNAFDAVALAQAGLPGPRGSIDGPFGYLRLFESDSDVAPVIAGLGATWRAAEVSWKPYPTGRAAHGGIDMTLQLRNQGLTPETLQRLTIYAPPLIHHLVGRPIRTPLEVNYARLCLPYVAAVALRYGSVGLEDFTPAALADPITADIAARISVEVVANADPAAFTPQRAVAERSDGPALDVGIDLLPGSIQRPLSPAEQIDKFRRCCTFGFGRERTSVVDALLAAFDDLTRSDDVGAIGRLAAGG